MWWEQMQILIFIKIGWNKWVTFKILKEIYTEQEKNGYQEDTSFQKGNLNFYIILFIENQKILNHKRQRNEKINQLETFNAISQNDKASNSDSTNLTLIPKKEGDDSNYSTPKRIGKYSKERGKETKDKCDNTFWLC